MTRPRRRPRHVQEHLALTSLLLASALVLVLTGCGGSTSTADYRAITDGPIANAPGDCWKRLLHDAYDGQIDRSFPPRCNSAALDQLPTDGATGLRATPETGAEATLRDAPEAERERRFEFCPRPFTNES